MIADGKLVAAQMRAQLEKKIRDSGKAWSLELVAVDPDPVTKRFMQAKMRFGEAIGVSVTVTNFESAVMSEDGLVSYLQSRKGIVSGLVVQLPLPVDWNRERILNSIPMVLDIDVLNEETYAAWQMGNSPLTPPVVFAVQSMADFYKLDFSGRKIVVVGQGRLVGMPVCDWLARCGYEFDILTLETPQDECRSLLRSADIVISGIGVPHHIVPDDVQEGVIILDAGSSEQSGKYLGDVSPAVAEKASFASLVPGGIGPLTIVGIYDNLLKLGDFE